MVGGVVFALPAQKHFLFLQHHLGLALPLSLPPLVPPGQIDRSLIDLLPSLDQDHLGIGISLPPLLLKFFDFALHGL